MAFPGFTKRHKGTISNGDWDRDGVVNRRDCNAMDFKQQDGGEVKFVRPTMEQLNEERKLNTQKEGASRMRSDVDSKIVNMGHERYADAEEKLRKLRRSYR